MTLGEPIPGHDTIPSLLTLFVLDTTVQIPWYAFPDPSFIVCPNSKMQCFSNKAKVVKSSKPAADRHRRRLLLVEALSIPQNVAMVSCTQCVNNKVTCYYNREQSVKCAECLKYHREGDGTFSLEEFRKVGEQRDRLESKALESQRELVRLEEQVALVQQQAAKARAKDLALKEQIADLKDRSSRMLRREMEALGVMESLDSEQVVALGEPVFSGPDLEVDWEAILQTVSDIPEGSLG